MLYIIIRFYVVNIKGIEDQWLCGKNVIVGVDAVLSYELLVS